MATWTDYKTFDWFDLFTRSGICPRSGKKKKKGEKDYINIISAFDIETSLIKTGPENTDAHSFMYIWMFCIEDRIIIGRTWDEWFDCLMILQAALIRCQEYWHLANKPYLMVWVHNLAYEFAFISGLYPFTNDEIFFRDVRKPIKCTMFDCFELRCSYIQSNMSLKALTKQTGVKVKLSGQEFDYTKLRFPWTELTDREMEYCITDVVSLVDAMRVRIERGGDTLTTVPLTSTGYVRRECKQSLKDRYLQILDLKPWQVNANKKEGDKDGFDIYRLLRDAFRGGNTHANRAYVGKICENVYSYDIASSYPTQQLTKKFPMKPYKFLCRCDAESVFMYIGLGYSVVGRYRFTKIKLRNKNEPIPYISLSRCQESTGVLLDNGRILSADYIEAALTEIDLKIIIKQYEFEGGKFEVTECMVAEKDYLPAEYRAVIQDYYDKKTLLKGATSDDDKYTYARSKGLLNAVYGMSATSASGEIIYGKIRDFDTGEIIDKEGGYLEKTLGDMTPEEIQKRLQALAFCYQWGVYTTALAREQLQLAIDLCGEKILYCDTDSVKTIGDAPIHKLNDELRKRAYEMGAYAYDREGREHPIGVFEFDGHYKQFITQGAKRYAYIDDTECKYAKTCPNYSKCKMHITVSGVTKQINEETSFSFAVEELQTLDRFKAGKKGKLGENDTKGMVWEKAGGTMAVYNDIDNFDYTDPETGKTVHIGKNVAIVPTTYEMTYSGDYNKLLRGLEGYAEFIERRK